nr:endocuticle structural glycoprotein SgAbd-8-like [Leptinotarsa decemlineata]
MTYLAIVGVSLGLILTCNCQGQYKNGGYNQEEQYNYQKAPPPQILTHKQALNHDGNFKYLFTSENGLAQGESIAPDGSRNGGYSYVDPSGRKISVKYTAGKEGFRILEADHLPKAPQPVAPLPVTQQQQTQAYQQPQPLYGRQHDDGQYRPQQYERPQQIQLPSVAHARPAYAPPLTVSGSPRSNALEDRDYNDEPGKPHSFGSGYLFEFSG